MKKIILACALALSACSGQQVLNTLSAGGDYQLASNVVYDDATGGRLDIYSPEGLKQAPTILFLYGARWSEGYKKEDYKFIGKAFADRGYVTVIPDYRKYPEVRFPAFVEDAAKALKWTHNNIYKYGGSSAKLFVMGHSSGAHMAAMLALNDEYLKAVGGSRGWLKGMIGLAGPYDFLPLTAPDLRDIFGPPEEFEKSQPIFYVDGKNPPMLLIHGEDDEVVAVKNTRNLAQAVAAAGGRVDTVIYPELSHRLIVGSLATTLQGRSDVMPNILGFVIGTMSGLKPAPESGVQGQALKEQELLPQGTALPPPPDAAPRPLAPEPAPQP